MIRAAEKISKSLGFRRLYTSLSVGGTYGIFLSKGIDVTGTFVAVEDEREGVGPGEGGAADCMREGDFAFIGATSKTRAKGVEIIAVSKPIQ
ncbi:hypothetical protein KSB_77520 [Ktedonobacter robiniae]|uniref:Uncharacterized protein n=1 Tax=Ktedonobacter robiniae TaxID=2778365 RepID=A0ABQ3V3Z0_9CHLR|nr:hypothetical protein KSB_77520 [Ktedonobacter robiniae]